MRPMKPDRTVQVEAPLAGAAATDNNLMPSMVVRQQRSQLASAACANPPIAQPRTLSLQASKKEPPSGGGPLIKAAVNESAPLQQVFDQDGLVVPKRLAHHPVSSAAQPIIRDLNRELKFNQTRGKNVLDQKSELRKALEKLEESKRKREVEQERLSRRTSLELRLEERAQRLARETAGSGAAREEASSSSPSRGPSCELGNFNGIRPLTR